MAGVAGLPVIYMGQGFSPKGDKERFVLPADVRRIVAEASNEKTVMLVAKDEQWECLMASGLSYGQQLAEEIRAERAAALANGEPMLRSKRQTMFGSLVQVNFDNSGRFVLPPHLKAQVGIEDAIYVHGMMDYFAIWAPDVLMRQEGAEWDGAKATCASLMTASGRGRK
jgi:MraZ protein